MVSKELDRDIRDVVNENIELGTFNLTPQKRLRYGSDGSGDSGRGEPCNLDFDDDDILPLSIRRFNLVSKLNSGSGSTPQFKGNPNLVSGTSKVKDQQHPETDFYNFEMNRQWELFAKDQVWALYDEYGMPRRYARINLVKSSNSGVSITLLRYKPPKRWSPNGEYKASGSLHTCGDFSPCKPDRQVSDNLSFSHKLSNAENFCKASYHIYPKKGEIWAFCKERDVKKTHLDLGSPRIQKYQIVEILADFCKYNGTRVVILVRNRGEYQSVFKRCCKVGNTVSFHVPIDELPRFSHQIPAFKITEDDNLIRGCWELDPLSLPRYIDDLTRTLEPNLDEKYLILRLLDSKNYAMAPEVDLCSNFWAVYDDRDHFPRLYARINKKTSQTSKISITWFGPNPRSNVEKKWHNAGLPIACGTFRAKKTVETHDHLLFSHQLSCRSRYFDGVEYLDIFPKMGEIWAIYKDWDMGWSSNLRRSKLEFEYEIVEVVHLSRDNVVLVVYLAKIDGFESVFRRQEHNRQEVRFKIPMNELLRFSHQISAYRVNECEVNGIGKGSWVLDIAALPCEFRGKIRDFTTVGTRKDEKSLRMDFSSVIDNPHTVIEKRSWCCSSEYSIKNSQQNMKHPKEEQELDDTKSEKRFMVNQIWALYDEIDRMPRCYVRVTKIISVDLKVEVVILKPHPIDEGEMKWIEEGLPMVCGIFKSSNLMTIKELSEFSHQVSCDERNKLQNFFTIFPKMGEIWAVYKDWSFNWKKSDFMKQRQFQMVEIISDFSSERGLTIAWLIRLQGSSNIFERQMHQGTQLVQQLSRSELLRFSHLIPAFQIMRDGRVAWKLDCNAEIHRQIIRKTVGSARS